MSFIKKYLLKSIAQYVQTAANKSNLSLIWRISKNAAKDWRFQRLDSKRSIWNPTKRKETLFSRKNLARFWKTICVQFIPTVQRIVNHFPICIRKNLFSDYGVSWRIALFARLSLMSMNSSKVNSGIRTMMSLQMTRRIFFINTWNSGRRWTTFQIGNSSKTP